MEFMKIKTVIWLLTDNWNVFSHCTILDNYIYITGDDRERPAVSEDIKRMKYLERVIKESLRIFPSVPMIARSIQQECVIGG